jgi:hypothetical protein
MGCEKTGGLRVMTERRILTRQEVLQLLSEQARAGSVTAAIALERSLRLRDEVDGSASKLDTEIDRLLERDNSER